MDGAHSQSRHPRGTFAEEESIEGIEEWRCSGSRWTLTLSGVPPKPFRKNRILQMCIGVVGFARGIH
jgi:hypothetical protein